MKVGCVIKEREPEKNWIQGCFEHQKHQRLPDLVHMIYSLWWWLLFPWVSTGVGQSQTCRSADAGWASRNPSTEIQKLWHPKLSVSSGVCADIPKFRKSDNGHSSCDTKPPAWLKQIGTFFLHSRRLKGEAYGLWSGKWKMAVPAQLSVPLFFF